MTMLTPRFEKTASAAALLLLILACYQVLRPFLFDILWAAILCFVTWPIYLTLRSWKLSSTQASVGMVLPISVFLLTPFVAAAWAVPEDVNRMLQWFADSAHTWPAAPEWLKNLPIVGDRVASSWQSIGEDSGRLMDFARKYVLTVSQWMLKQGLGLAGEMMHMGLSILILFFLYRDGEQIAKHIIIAIQQLAGAQTERILHVIRSSLRAVVYGMLGTALVQAMVSIVGFLLVDVPYAFALGFIAFFLMIIPAAGTLIWLPISAWLLIEGEIGKAIFISIWFLLFVGTIDNWLRPILISREVQLPFVLIMFGILGGLLAFGFIGIFIGPTLLATSYALLLDWLIRKEKEALESSADIR